MIHLLKFFVAKKSVPNVDKRTLTVLLAMDPANVSLSSICTATNLVLAALVQRDNSEFHAFMPSIATNSIAFG